MVALSVVLGCFFFFYRILFYVFMLFYFTRWVRVVISFGSNIIVLLFCFNFSGCPVFWGFVFSFFLLVGFGLLWVA